MSGEDLARDILKAVRKAYFGLIEGGASEEEAQVAVSVAVSKAINTIGVNVDLVQEEN